MLTRRKLVLGAALAVLVPAAPALAAPDPLLADILYGVSDALIRDYIYRNYEYGRWDGRYWWYRGNRYTPATYRRFWIDDYYRHYPPPPPPPHFDGLGGRPPPPLRPPALCGRKASGRTGSGPAPAALRRSRPQAAACRRSGAPSSVRRRSPLTPLRLNRLCAGHEREIRPMWSITPASRRRLEKAFID